MSTSVCIREVVAQRCSVKKVFFKIYEKLTGKHLRQSLFLNKVASLRPKKKNCLFPSDRVSKKNLTWEAGKKLFFLFFS